MHQFFSKYTVNYHQHCSNIFLHSSSRELRENFQKNESYLNEEVKRLKLIVEKSGETSLGKNIYVVTFYMN